MTDFLLLAFIFLCASVISVPIASRLVVALSMLLMPTLVIMYDKIIAPRYATGESREAEVNAKLQAILKRNSKGEEQL